MIARHRDVDIDMAVLSARVAADEDEDRMRHRRALQDQCVAHAAHRLIFAGVNGDMEDRANGNALVAIAIHQLAQVQVMGAVARNGADALIGIRHEQLVDHRLQVGAHVGGIAVAPDLDLIRPVALEQAPEEVAAIELRRPLASRPARAGCSRWRLPHLRGWLLERLLGGQSGDAAHGDPPSSQTKRRRHLEQRPNECQRWVVRHTTIGCRPAATREFNQIELRSSFIWGSSC